MENASENPVPQSEVKKTLSGKETNNIKMFAWGAAGLIVLVAIVISGVGIYRVYAKGASDGFTATVAKVLRLPVGKVNGETLFYSDYLGDLKAIHTLNAYDKAAGGATAGLTDVQMSDQVIWRMVNNVLINNIAKNIGVTVADKDVSDLKAQMVSQFKGGEQEAEQELIKRYGWTMKDYESKVMRPFVLQQKLSEAYSTDTKLREDLRKKAEGVLAEIKAGANFEEMAKKYGEDGTAASGGDLGWFGKGEMVPQFEAAAFALKKGEITQELVETSYGYHIIRLDDRKTEKVKDAATGKMVDAEKVSAHHIIFLFPSLEKSLDTAVKTAKIRVYGVVHDPFADLNKPATTATTTQ